MEEKKIKIDFVTVICITIIVIIIIALIGFCIIFNKSEGNITSKKKQFQNNEQEISDNIVNTNITNKVDLSSIDTAGWFSEGLASVSNKTNLYGFIDKQGNLVVDFIYDTVKPFTEGVALVEKNGKCGFIDQQGNIVIDFQYDTAGSFVDGLAVVEKNNKYGFIDKQGNLVINFQYDSAYSFSDGIAGVQKNGKWGCIDKHK